MHKVLIVEDDKYISQLISDYCRASGYEPIVAESGDVALRLYESEDPDIILLDIIVPVIDGFELCRRIRRDSAKPIIMISSKNEDADKILVLGLGADDYVEKPFSPRVLMAKISALLRRTHELSGENRSDKVEHLGITIDQSTRTCQKNGEDIELSKLEFDILFFLISNLNKVFSREIIFDRVWGAGEYGDVSTVTVHVKKIRLKIEDDPSKPKILQTVWGVGYVIRD